MGGGGSTGLGIIPKKYHFLVPPLSQVLKTGQGVVEYLKLEGILDIDTIIDIGKNVLQLTELKISMILSLQDV